MSDDAADGPGGGAGVKRLFLLRHAKSSWKDEALDDFDRPLSKRGRAAAAIVGGHLAREGFAPDQVLCSPAKRTRETLDRIQQSLGSPLPVRFEKALYLAEAPNLLRRLRRLNDTVSSVMLVGHNPGLERLALLLVADGEDRARRQLALKFPTAALAVIGAEIDQWVSLAPGCGRLEAFLRARELDGES